MAVVRYWGQRYFLPYFDQNLDNKLIFIQDNAFLLGEVYVSLDYRSIMIIRSGKQL